MKDSEILFTQIFERTAKNFASVHIFRHATRLGLSYASTIIHKESIQFAEELAFDEEYENLFVDKDKFFESKGGLKGLARNLADSRVQSYQRSVDAASIVFSHSILDGAAIDYCRVTALEGPLDWESLLKKRQVSLEEVKNQTYEAILSEQISSFLIKLERKSLLEKVDRLFQICKPQPNFSPVRNYVYKREKLVELDNLRHKIIHGTTHEIDLDSTYNEVKYFQDTASFLMALVNMKYGTKIVTTVPSS